MNKTKQTDLILIIDDSLNNLEIAGSILESAGYDVIPVSNGYDGLKILSNTQPELILLDVMMPDMDGNEVCKRIKQIESLRDIRVIFLTALNETGDIIKAFNSGGLTILLNPLSKKNFLLG